MGNNYSIYNVRNWNFHLFKNDLKEKQTRCSASTAEASYAPQNMVFISHWYGNKVTIQLYQHIRCTRACINNT